MNFTEHFDYRDFFVSAVFPDLANKMWEKKRECKYLKAALYQLAHTVIEPTRQFVNRPLEITSGFRSQELHNALRRAGLATSRVSLHSYGIAADIKTWHIRDTEKLGIMYGFIQNELSDKYSQLIYYPDRHFIHVALPFSGYEQITKEK
jgi:uncharacterized protein YcbK (DUF882 family)